MSALLAMLFVHPLDLPAGARLWMMLPLVACVVTVYRGTRARHPREMPRSTVVTFFNVVLGMALIAAGFYVLHMVVRRWF